MGSSAVLNVGFAVDKKEFIRPTLSVLLRFALIKAKKVTRCRAKDSHKQQPPTPITLCSSFFAKRSMCMVFGLFLPTICVAHTFFKLL